MWIKAAGPLTESVFHLTTAVSTHALILGEESALVDASIAAASERVIEQVETHLGMGANLDFVFLTHCHFDHIGGIPALRKRFADLQVIGGPQSSELLSDNAYVEQCYERNLVFAEAARLNLEIDKKEWCESIRIDRIMGDGDLLQIGDDVEVKLIACPGHTEDSVAYFVHPDGVLACAESVGSYAGRDKVAACFGSDLNRYLESLDKLSGLDVQALCLPHSGAISGEMVPKFFVEARLAAERFRDDVRERLEQGQLVEEIFEALLPEWQAEQIAPEGPFAEEQKETLLTMIKSSAS